VIIATDAPLDGRQLGRLAKRAALGLARTGATARHGSGDFMLAFSTGNTIPHYPKDRTFVMTHLADTHLNPLLSATVEATEEAVLNALWSGIAINPTDPQGYYVPLWSTLSNAAIGFGIGTGLGLVLGSLMAESRTVEKLLMPYAFALQSLPKVAIAPLVVIWVLRRFRGD